MKRSEAEESASTVDRPNRTGGQDGRLKAWARRAGGAMGALLGRLVGRERAVKMVGQAARSLLQPYGLTVLEAAAFWETGANDLVVVRQLNDSPVRMLLDPRDHVVSQLIVRQGGWEPHVLDALRAFLHPGITFLDVGANLGYYSLRVAAECTWARVHSFEPFPANYRLLQAAIRLNGLEDRVHAYPVACSDENRSVWLAGAEWTSGGKGIRLGEGPDPTWPSLMVDARRLDDFLPDLVVDLVKLDVEGHEPQALRGMWGTILRNHPVIVTELGLEGLRERGATGLRGMLSPFVELGYHISYLLPDGPQPCGQDLDRVARICQETGGLGEALLCPATRRPRHGARDAMAHLVGEAV